jgi:hypothetical protein
MVQGNYVLQHGIPLVCRGHSEPGFSLTRGTDRTFAHWPFLGCFTVASFILIMYVTGLSISPSPNTLSVLASYWERFAEEFRPED